MSENATPHIDLTPIIEEAGGRGQKGDDVGRSVIFTVDLKSLTGQDESEWEGL